MFAHKCQQLEKHQLCGERTSRPCRTLLAACRKPGAQGQGQDERGGATCHFLQLWRPDTLHRHSPGQAGAVTSFFVSQYFLMWTFFKVFAEFVTVSLLFYVFAFWPHGMCMWDLSSLSRDRPCAPCIGW